MQHNAAPEWLKLDNAAKIYPPAMSRKWAAMFRLSVTLADPVDQAVLAKALEATLRRIPTFSYQLRRGAFWYYLERMDKTPEIQPDAGNPLMRIDFDSNRNFLFRVRCHNNRIAVEIFHALTDGIGGLTFLLTMTAEYCRRKYGDEIPCSPLILDCALPPQKSELEDSFLHVARGAVNNRHEASAYHIDGTQEQAGFLNIVTGMMPIGRVSAEAKKRGCSITVLLASVLISSIQEHRKSSRFASNDTRPIKVSIPVNLRRFYPTQTLRNFSSYVNVGIDCALGEHSLEEIIVQVKHSMGREITEKKLNARFSANVKAERNVAVRLMPLPIKNPLLKALHLLQGDRFCTTTLSNVGDVDLPSSLCQRVTRMDFLLGASRSNVVSCACIGCSTTLTCTFTRMIEEADIERVFFTSLVRMGIPVRIESNQRW